MTMKVFLGFQRKPAKSPASSVARAFGMSEQPTDDSNWIFAKGRFRIRLEDLRTDLQPEYREWADEVGWVHNWAVSIAVHHRGRTDIDYIKWHALVAVIMEAYDLNLLWTDSGTDTPQYHMRLNDFVPSLISENADDLKPDEDVAEEPVASAPELKEEPKAEPEPEIPDSVMDALRLQIRAEMEADTGSTAKMVDEPVVEEPKLVPLEVVDDEDDDDDDFDSFDDWDDDEDEDEVEDEDEGADIGPITDWD